MAKTYDFTKYKVDTSVEKASPNLEHDFKPIEDDPDIVVKCCYFKAAEKASFLNLGEDAASFDFRRIFAKKVLSISGLVLTVTDKKTGKPAEIEIKDPQVLLSFPDEGIVNELVSSVAKHLVHGDTLTEAEEGN